MTIAKLYLGGEWTAGTGSLDVQNPATGEVIATVATIDRPRVAQALQDAHAAFPSWRGLTMKRRGQYLRATAEELERRAEQIACIITQENGKPLRESRIEVAGAIDHLQWFAEEGRRAYGHIIPPQTEDKRHMVVKVPVGVVGAISPWNFPLILAVRKVAPALAAGCPVVLKPASATPLCAIEFGKAMEAAGVPAGVFQLVLGKASEIAGEMLANPVCRKISFTGSTEVGRQLIAGAAATVTRLSLELGGHAPVLVFEDADLENAVQGVLDAKFRNSGQSCIAANRIYVQRSIYKAFLDRLSERVGRLRAGNGVEDSSDIGPLINARALDAALRQIEDAKRQGARVLAGGQRIPGGGYFLQPTVLADVPAHAVCMTEETFAPIAPVTAFDTEEEAVQRANGTIYGLAAYAFTRDVNRAWRLSESLDAGTIGINDAVPSTSNCPFGGMKQSGWGRELGHEGLEAFLETKHVSFGSVTE